SWVMQQILFRLRKDERYDVLKLDLEDLVFMEDVQQIAEAIGNDILEALGKPPIEIKTLKAFQDIFKQGVLDKPLVLILDEFDTLPEHVISGLVRIFRKIYLHRQDDPNPSAQKAYLLHGVALIGVRSVLGIENVKGSPFNVQRSLHIPNLTFEEVDGMFKWYERESGQNVKQEVIGRLYDEVKGQPGLTCWFGELLTEGFEEYRPPKDQPIATGTFERVYVAATSLLPNSNIVNILSKAKQEPYKSVVFELFKTGEQIQFTFDDAHLNYLYMNGIINREVVDESTYRVKFDSPFVQKRLFNYFARDLFGYTGQVRAAFEDVSAIMSPEGLNIKNLALRFEVYLKENRDWLLKDAPKRKDLRIYEAVYHFCLYRYLCDFLGTKHARVYPEFPTGNGKIDLIIRYHDHTYGLELKSYTDETGYKEALQQAAKYGKEYGFPQVWLLSFVEYVDDATRQKYEKKYVDRDTGVGVMPLFVETGR
ncbi:MAG: hypothetical protein GY801_06740, partial [bacterium]|nr:hypothetical protein [bacterium]